jgi:hypothetical protein
MKRRLAVPWLAVNEKGNENAVQLFFITVISNTVVLGSNRGLKKVPNQTGMRIICTLMLGIVPTLD